MLARALAIAVLCLLSTPALAKKACKPGDASPILTWSMGFYDPKNEASRPEFELWASGYWRGQKKRHGCATPTDMTTLKALLDAVKEPTTVPNPAVCRANPEHPVVVTGPDWRATWIVPCPAVIPSPEVAAVLGWVGQRLADRP